MIENIQDFNLELCLEIVSLVHLLTSTIIEHGPQNKQLFIKTNSIAELHFSEQLLPN